MRGSVAHILTPPDPNVLLLPKQLTGPGFEPGPPKYQPNALTTAPRAHTTSKFYKEHIGTF